MRILTVSPPPPPKEIQMTFTVSEGWAVLAAIQDWAAAHPRAEDIEKWREWASILDKELRA